MWVLTESTGGINKALSSSKKCIFCEDGSCTSSKQIRANISQSWMSDWSFIHPIEKKKTDNRFIETPESQTLKYFPNILQTCFQIMFIILKSKATCLWLFIGKYLPVSKGIKLFALIWVCFNLSFIRNAYNLKCHMTRRLSPWKYTFN